MFSVHQFKYTNTYFVYTEVKTNEKNVFFPLLFARDRSRPLLILHSWNHMTSYENDWNNNRQQRQRRNVFLIMPTPCICTFEARCRMHFVPSCCRTKQWARNINHMGFVQFGRSKSRQTRFTSLDSCRPEIAANAFAYGPMRVQWLLQSASQRLAYGKSGLYGCAYADGDFL